MTKRDKAIVAFLVFAGMFSAGNAVKYLPSFSNAEKSPLFALTAEIKIEVILSDTSPASGIKAATETKTVSLA